MNPAALGALEFDRIVAAVSDLAVTTTGRARLAALHPSTDAATVAATQRSTSEGVRFLGEHPGFPLRAPSDLDTIIAALEIDGRPLEPRRLLALSDYLDSIEQSRGAVLRLEGPFPSLQALVQAIASFKN